MPELPEVETVVRQLRRVLPGKIVAAITGTNLPVMGTMITGVERKQKIIAVIMDEVMVILVHLKMTGQLIYIGDKAERIVGGHPTKDWVEQLPSKHTRVEVDFTDGSRLFFNDQRKFGWMRLVTHEQWKLKQAAMPPDVVDETFTKAYLQSVLERSARPVKLVILDQALIGGMGNIYANDALFVAKIQPKTPANQLKADAVKRLYEAMKAVIDKGIETGGASLSHFVDIEGMGGHYQDHFLVYDKEGKLCPECGTKIQKIQLGGRGTYFCPTCQV